MTRLTAHEQAAALRRILEKILVDRGWTPRQWALKAGIDPTTLTRFLNSGHNFVLSSRSLGKLSNAAGVDIGIANREPNRNGKAVPVYKTPGDKGVGYVTKTIITNSLDDNDFACVIGTSHMNVAGIMRGDFIVIAPGEQIVAGDRVVVMIGDNYAVLVWTGKDYTDGTGEVVIIDEPVGKAIKLFREF